MHILCSIVLVLLLNIGYQFCRSQICPDFTRGSNVAVFDEKCYQYNFMNVTWETAKSECEINNGTLAPIPDEGVQTFITNHATLWLLTDVATSSLYWIGGRIDSLREPITHDWITGEENIYSNWEEGYPTEMIPQCIALSEQLDGLWVTRPCNSTEHTFSYICRYETVETLTEILTTTEETSTNSTFNISLTTGETRSQTTVPTSADTRNYISTLTIGLCLVVLAVISEMKLV